MHITQVLYKQHLGRTFRKQWETLGKVKLYISRIETALIQKGFTVLEPEDIVEEKKQKETVEIIGCSPRVPVKDKTHPLWKERPCLIYHSKTSLPEGFNQAKILCKTVEFQQGLPPALRSLVGSEEITGQDDFMQRYILQSRVYDATQKKLPLHVDLNSYHKTAYPRKWGIPRYRRNFILLNNILRLCATLNAKYPETTERTLNQSSPVISFMEKDEDLYKFTIKPLLLLTADRPLAPYVDETEVQTTSELPLPDIYPIRHNLNIWPQNLYNTEPVFPVAKTYLHPHAHTVVFSMNTEWRSKLSQDQFYGRTLVNTFAVALAQVYQRFGNNVTVLPEPVTINCIHTDGRRYHFGVFQLNSLDVNGTDGIKNIFWSEDMLNLYTICNNLEGNPILEDYNPEVFRIFIAMYLSGAF